LLIDVQVQSKGDTALRLFLTFVLMYVLATAAEAQDRRDWQSLAQLKAGDRIRLTLKTGPVDGPFQSWTLQQVTAGTVTAKRQDVLKMERYRQGGRDGASMPLSVR
jgi:hypothetical protein